MKRYLPLTSLLIGCMAPVHTASDSYQVRLDPSLTDEQVMVIQLALKDWEVQAGAHFSNEVSSSEKCHLHGDTEEGCIHIAYTSRPQVAAACPNGINPPGCTNVERMGEKVWAANIQVSSLGDYTTDHQVLLHEIGHALSLQHDVKGTVMAANLPDGYPEITQLDIAQYQRLHAE